MHKKIQWIVIAIPLSLLLVVLIYQIPPVHDRLAWRVDEWLLRIRYTINPPQQVVFKPQEHKPLPALRVTHQPTPSPTPSPASNPTPPGPTTIPTPLPTPTEIPTPIPSRVALKGVVYEDQHGRWNYCAPANLAMALSYWGWKGNRDTVGPVLKPDPKDKNVMLYEMATYVEQNTSLRAALRSAGDNDLLKRFLAAGFPVLVEKGAYLTDLTGVKSWMGHYQVVTGYDDGQGIFIAQDSFTGADTEVPYETMTERWRAFNFSYVIIYPPDDKETQVVGLLGADADETTNKNHAAQKASDEVYALSGIDQYFAWYNRGTSLVALQDYAGAAMAYDSAFEIYPTIPEDKRPWRMVWYQTGPYFAYFYTGRYYDVLNLADTTLNAMQSDKNLEESYYWRGMAKAALGDTSGAISDYQTSLQYHPGFEPALFQLRQLGVNT